MNRGEYARQLTDLDLISAMREVASALGVQVLSTQQYDAYRDERAPQLPSTSAIRHWLGGGWVSACDRAGLEAPSTAGARLTRVGGRARLRAAMLADLRAAWWATDGELRPWRYASWLTGLSEREAANRSRADDVIAEFRSWSKAVAAAGILPGGAFHPDARQGRRDLGLMWTVADTRRLIRRATVRHGGRPLTANYWRPAPGSGLPSWKTVCDLMPPMPWGL